MAEPNSNFGISGIPLAYDPTTKFTLRAWWSCVKCSLLSTQAEKVRPMERMLGPVGNKKEAVFSLPILLFYSPGETSRAKVFLLGTCLWSRELKGGWVY